MQTNSDKMRPIHINGKLWALYDIELKAIFIIPKCFGIPESIYKEIYNQLKSIISEFEEKK